MFEGSMEPAFYAGAHGELDAQGRLEELHKALETSYLRQDQVNGQAMVPQSLENTLVSTTFKERHLVMWKDMPKEKAYSTVEEFTTLDEVGTRDHDGAGFFVQGGKPGATDLSATRRWSPIKFMGTERGVVHPMTLVRSLRGPEGLPANDAEAKEVFGGTRWLLRQLERTIPFADADCVPTGITGIERQILGTTASKYANIVSEQPNIIDCRGSFLTNGNMEDAAECIENNFGNVEAARLYMDNHTLGAFGKYLVDNKLVRINLESVQGENGQLLMGAPARGYRSNFGFVPFRNSRFLDIRNDVAPAARTSDKAPLAPTADTTYHSTGIFVDDPAGSETSKFVSGDAGTYAYRITAINHYGESAPLELTGVAVTAGKVVRFSLNQAGGKWTANNDENATMAYRIYRSTKGGAASTCKFIDTVAADDCAADKVVDFNYFIPGTARAFLSDMSPEDSISMRILTPLLKWPLAIVDTRVRFLLLLYLSHVILYAPKKHVEFINIGEYTAIS